MKILLIILLMTFVEIFTFIKVGALVGGFTAISITILSAIIGISLVKAEAGKEQLKAIQKMQTGETPVEESLSGLYLLLAGILLLIPGLISDLLGIILLIPFVRKLFVKKTLSKLSSLESKTSNSGEFCNIQMNGKRFSHSSDDTIDGVFEETHNDN